MVAILDPTARKSPVLRRNSKSFRAPLIADWAQAAFFHFKVDAAELQNAVPFPLDLFEGDAYLSLVAFTLRKMRPVFGGKVTAALFNPIATHEFLNIRTYIRHNDEPGIYFLREYLSNRLSVPLGPLAYGLPYHFAQINYQHDSGVKMGQVRAPEGDLEYKSSEKGPLACAESGSLNEFLVERYLAGTGSHRRRQIFRVEHEPWLQCSMEVAKLEGHLLENAGPWAQNATLVCANYSPGVTDVRMGWPQRV